MGVTPPFFETNFTFALISLGMADEKQCDQFVLSCLNAGNKGRQSFVSLQICLGGDCVPVNWWFRKKLVASEGKIFCLHVDL